MSAPDGAPQPPVPGDDATPVQHSSTESSSPEPDADPDAQGAATPTPLPHAGLRYAVLRVAMLVTVGGVLALVGMRGWLLLFTAVLVSAVLSFFVFARQREAAARNLEASLARRQAQDAKWRAAAEASKPTPPVDDAAGDPRPEG
jgi:hypothetical protein